MRNKKKIFFKNRVKYFFIAPGECGKSRVKEYEGLPDYQKDDGLGQEDNHGIENPQDQGDLS